MDDRALLQLARAGDRAAGDVFVSRHLDAVLRYARAVTRDDVAAEDVVQDVFLAALRAEEPLTGPSARGWLLVAARHASFRRHRRRVGEPARFEPLDALGLAAGWGADPETLVSANEDRRRLETALGALSVEDREILILRDLEGVDGETTARELGLGVAAMKSRLHRARLHLMAALNQGGVDGA